MKQEDLFKKGSFRVYRGDADKWIGVGLILQIFPNEGSDFFYSKRFP